MVRVSEHRHSFSIELTGGENLNRVLIPGGSSGALIEGELGEGIRIEIVEGVLLQISGDAGTFRLDLDEGEADQIKAQLGKMSSSENGGEVRK